MVTHFHTLVGVNRTALRPMSMSDWLAVDHKQSPNALPHSAVSPPPDLRPMSPRLLHLQSIEATDERLTTIEFRLVQQNQSLVT